MTRKTGSMKVQFTKMEGTGNDFIMVNAVPGSLDMDWPSFAARFCPVKTGIGADGVIVLSPDTLTDFRFRIFNADGSEAEMCGNGARCAALFAYRQGIAGKALRFSTMAGIVEARVHNDGAAVQMTVPFGLDTGIVIPVHGSERTVHFVNTGVPHTIVFTDHVDEEPVFEHGRLIRYHDRFAPSGTNVDFVEKVGSGCIRVRTYERGVEGETLACGTGAVASAIVSYHLGTVRDLPVTVRMRGGDLKIDFTPDGGAYADVWLTGPVTTVFTGEAMVSL
ncbi:MAG TPA: diaminopimelate epimerase [Deltaproteobacteria bacterium]|jgi:diaminopimelate epimerase|nr:diaminopimelate epimerase [Deltaproteobacteria bacterium]HNQ85156.1 diaminopimelate epimerase [Deltaproteobacteria bacterium]HNS89456.1 diaminopimelate epimerase [Deltaproteobacteria bacterium]HOA43687.1 diaminopimelate epimerase [Deltaproteobacteria bacterium]HOC75126.1 diaminopimelate epimerase [Deltaproteobacteria bacterium]